MKRYKGTGQLIVRQLSFWPLLWDWRTIQERKLRHHSYSASQRPKSCRITICIGMKQASDHDFLISGLLVCRRSRFIQIQMILFPLYFYCRLSRTFKIGRRVWKEYQFEYLNNHASGAILFLSLFLCARVFMHGCSVNTPPLSKIQETIRGGEHIRSYRNSVHNYI